MPSSDGDEIASLLDKLVAEEDLVVELRERPLPTGMERRLIVLKGSRAVKEYMDKGGLVNEMPGHPQSQTELFRTFGSVAGLAGLVVGVLLVLFSQVIQRNIFSSMNPDQSYRIVLALMIFTFGIAGIGIIAWLIAKTVGPAQPVPAPAPYILAVLIALVVAAAVYTGAGAQPTGPTKSVKVCFGGGGGNNCLDGADLRYDCNTYHAWNQKRWDDLATNLCGGKDRMSILQTQNNDGGGCGWTAYKLTCK